MTTKVVLDPYTYRFKMTPLVVSKLTTFACANKDVHRKTFQSNWMQWLAQNAEEVGRETERLKARGYRGDPVDKMYKSARYYFRNKSDAKSEPCAPAAPTVRRTYRSMGRELLTAMDAHLLSKIDDDDFTPAGSYVDFCRTCQRAIRAEIQTMLDCDDVDAQYIIAKVKKTYKNRYFVMSRKHTA